MSRHSCSRGSGISTSDTDVYFGVFLDALSDCTCFRKGTIRGLDRRDADVEQDSLLAHFTISSACGHSSGQVW